MQRHELETKTSFVARSVQGDLKPKSGGHLARVIVSGAMLVFGLGIVATHYIVAVAAQVPAQWGRNELILTLSLVGGGIAILFTDTFVSVMKVMWPFGKGK